MSPCETISELNLAYQELSALRHFAEQQLKGNFTKEDLQFYFSALQTIKNQVQKMKYPPQAQFGQNIIPDIF